MDLHGSVCIHVVVKEGEEEGSSSINLNIEMLTLMMGRKQVDIKKHTLTQIERELGLQFI